MSYVFTAGTAVSLAGIAVYAYAMGMERIGGVLAAAVTVAAFALVGVDPALLSLIAFLSFALGSLKAREVFHSKAIGIMLALLGAALIAAGDLNGIGQLALVSGMYIADVFVTIINSVMGMQDPTGGIFVLIALMITASYVAKYIAEIHDPLIASITAFGVAYLAIYIASIALYNLFAAASGLFQLIPIIVLVIAAAAVVDIFRILEHEPKPEAIVWIGPLAVLANAFVGVNVVPLIGALGLITAVVAILSEKTNLYVTAIFMALSALAAAGA